MTNKFTFVLATSVALAAVPQVAQASCSGSACKSISFAGNKFTNNDKDLKIHLTGCFLQGNGTCAPSANIDITIDPNSSKSVTPPASLGSNAKVDVKTAAFVGALTQPHVQTLPNGNTALVQFSAVVVKNDGKVPLKVVILDNVTKKELGRSNDYLLGNFPTINLNRPVSEYIWEVFTPGALEPCDAKHNITAASITVRCASQTPASQTPASQTPVSQTPPLPPFAQVAEGWAKTCEPNGAGGPMETCCSRQRRAEPHCTRQPVFQNVAEDCDNAERLCRGLVKK